MTAKQAKPEIISNSGEATSIYLACPPTGRSGHGDRIGDKARSSKNPGHFSAENGHFSSNPKWRES